LNFFDLEKESTSVHKFLCFFAIFTGSSEAWRNLAAMYYTGDGIPKSEETAKEIMRVMFNGEKSG
jgi:hypothetical protein